MKKFTLHILLVLILLFLVGMPVSAENEIQVFIDGKTVAFDQPPVIIDGRTLVPMRAIFENLGATVDWEADTYTAVGKKDGITVKITIGDNTLYKNETGIALDVPAKLIGGRTMVPARAISEAFGAYVSWNPAYQYVFVETQDEFKAKYLSKIGTHNEIVAKYDVSTQRTQSEAFYAIDKLNHLALIEFSDTGTVTSDKFFGNIDDGTNAYYYNDETIKPTDMDVWAYPASKFINFADDADGQVLGATFVDESDLIRVYRYTMTSGYIDYLFDLETAELGAIYVSPEASAMLLTTTAEPSIKGEKVTIPGSGDELYVFFVYDENLVKPLWDSIIGQNQ